MELNDIDKTVLIINSSSTVVAERLLAKPASLILAGASSVVSVDTSASPKTTLDSGCIALNMKGQAAPPVLSAWMKVITNMLCFNN